MVWENVPGAFSSGTPKGEDFRIVLEEIVRIKVGGVSVPRPDTGRWESAGRIVLGTDFSLAWRCLDAQYWGVPQRRKRIFLVADFAGRSAGQILFDPESLPGYPGPLSEEKSSPRSSNGRWKSNLESLHRTATPPSWKRTISTRGMKVSTCTECPAP